MVDASLHNSWQIAELQGNPISQLEFRQDVALSYLTRYQQLPKSAGQRPNARPTTLEKRYDGTNHLVLQTERSEDVLIVHQLCAQNAANATLNSV